jgi:serine/threonine-protein kinase
MPIPPGGRLGAYEIVAPLGAGGMGEVYRARDTRLERDVAIKILPAAFSHDAERLARFEREAKTLASLNHPHIAHIHGLEESNGAIAIVMELVEGDELSARIARGPLALDQALPIALQIADALEAAHERGIIHRDLKPANIKVRGDGTVKVLDFGLAKAAAPEGASGAGQLMNSPTMTSPATEMGLILGTAGYMAPEQARGQAVDRRADIWAFGVVLFEMLAGAQAFRGDTISDVLASVLKTDIDWRALPADLPPALGHLLRRCIDPDRRTRLRDIGEARIAIAEFIAHPQALAPGSAPPPRRERALRSWQIATVVTGVALMGALASIAFPGAPAAEPSMRFVVTPPVGVSALVSSRPSVAMAPDGWTIVFVGLENGLPHLFVRGAGDFEPRRLPGTEGAGNPEFSPDGRTLAFLTNSQLKTMPIDGAASVHGAANDPRGVAWIDRATLVYTPESIGGLVEVPLSGGSPRALTTLDDKAGERTHRWPHVLPGGEWVLFTVGTISTPDAYDDGRIDAVHRRTGERRHVFAGASMARYAPTGHLVFARAGSLFAVRFDPQTLKISGEPAGVLQGVGGDATTGAVHVSWSGDGTVAYVPGDLRGGMRELVWADLKGTRRSIDLPPSLYNDIRLSPDGRRVALTDGTSGLADLSVYTFERGTQTRLTFNGRNATPIWSPDSRDIYYTAIDAGRGSTVFKVSADGGREPVAVATADARVYLKHVSADGRSALVDYIAFGGARANIGRMALAPGATIEPIVNTRADEYTAALSPNGRYLAYASDEAGIRHEIFVREPAASSGRWQVSNAGGEEPMWSPDGRWLYYRIESRLMRVPIGDGPAFQAGLPVLLFDDIYNLRSDTGISYHPHPDGTRLLMTRPAAIASGGAVRVMTRWFDELKAIK